MVVYLRVFSRPEYPEYDQFAGRKIQRNDAAFAVSSGLEKGEQVTVYRRLFRRGAGLKTPILSITPDLVIIVLRRLARVLAGMP